MRALCAGGWIWLAAGLAAPAESSIDAAHRLAYGANVGWMNLRGDVTNGVVVGEFVCRGLAYGANIGWIRFGNGAPTNGIRYGNRTADDYGVNHDGAGGLSGFAYGANVGWIQFVPARGAPRMDLATGRMSGHAFGANIGWISLSNLEAHVRTDWMEGGPDTDGDGMPDAWESTYRPELHELKPGGADYDHDGVPDVEEYRADTNPDDPDDWFGIRRLVVANETNMTVTWASRPTRLYRLEKAIALDEFTPWGEALPGLVRPDAGGTTERSFEEPWKQRMIYRAVAVRPLAP